MFDMDDVLKNLAETLEKEESAKTEPPYDEPETEEYEEDFYEDPEEESEDFEEEEYEDEEYDEDDYDDDDDYEDYDEGFEYGDEDSIIYEVECACGKIINFDEETLEEGSIICPDCGETLEFTFEDVEEEE